MLAYLKNHPFAVEAHFESSFVVTYAVPKERVAHMIPECLELDTFNDTWAFVAIAMVQTKNLRPKGFPSMFGNDFFLIGYRIFVKYHTSAGKRLRGLYILKSETDKRKMKFFGNMFTHYNYSATDVELTNAHERLCITSQKSGLTIELEEAEDAALPLTSPFSDWKEARRFAGPLPFTFTYQEKKKEVLIIEGVRQNWTPKPVRVIRHEIDFLKSPEFEGAVLANAFVIRNIPYYWKKGKIDSWKE